MNPRIARRTAAIAGVLSVFAVAFAGTRPAAKGVSYRIQMTSRMPAIMAQASGDPAGPAVVAKVKSIGNRARFDFQQAPRGVSVEGYVLMLDSGRVVFVDTTGKAYSEAPAAFGGSGGVLGMISSIAGASRRREGSNAPQMEITGLVTDVQQLDGEVLDGRQVRHYQLVAEMNVQVMGNIAPLRVEMEMWTADLPQQIVNPFDLKGTVSPDDPAAKFTAKLIEMRKKVQGTPLKTITNVSITGLGNGALPPIEFQQTTAITDIQSVDVNPKELEIPAGFVRKQPGSER